MILNIVTLKRQTPLEATVNLVGPIVINRRTREGRQLVISELFTLQRPPFSRRRTLQGATRVNSR